MEQDFDRTSEDIGNSVGLEHVNVQVPDQQLATLFYISGLGLTRDPYLMPGLDNMWVNVGRSQFHLPTRPAQVVRGHVGIVLPDREGLLRRLAAVRERLANSRFAVREAESHVEAVCPWGNRIRCFEPDLRRFGRTQLGMAYVEFEVPRGVAASIAGFYRDVIKAPAGVEQDQQGALARVLVGRNQHLLFREVENPSSQYDGHHIQIYIADFSGPHRWLKKHGLITQESDQHQYRFLDIADPESGKPVFRLEHEVRSMTHPLYARPLVNRNPNQTNRNFAADYEAAQLEMRR